jgi:hypothetical protein
MFIRVIGVIRVIRFMRIIRTIRVIGEVALMQLAWSHARHTVSALCMCVYEYVCVYICVCACVLPQRRRPWWPAVRQQPHPPPEIDGTMRLRVIRVIRIIRVFD